MGKCCEKCFLDQDIKDRIRSINEIGECDFCKSKDVFVFDNEKAKSIADYDKNIVADFNELLTLYVVLSPELEQYSDYSQKLADQLADNTNIFNIEKPQISRLLKDMLKKQYSVDKALFDLPVIPKYLLDDETQKQSGIFKGKSWADFEEDIKYNSRFHSELPNEKIFKLFFNEVITTLETGKRFFRARISDSGEPILPRNMWSAPKGKASAGRLNASGIGYLYLAEKETVAIAEIKASLNDVCTIATFEMTEPAYVVDLSKITNLSIFSLDNKEIYLMNFEILNKIDEVMRKLSRKDRLELEYIPTEFISDFIKYMGTKDQHIDGIRYKSTVDDETVDIVLFDGKKVKQLDKEIRTYNIQQITYPTLKSM
ncbi:RES family NAD+ phosphorylase [Companilactobacillus formosensis]|uniref:RES family NAD+ phosphorylase n=1 Tax=Companilactobacillus formosensis TaxID=1617889 RepID=UPI000E658179|nr:RES family NAD+ phosphorylase [Companilactobacillus formosensis]